MLRKQKKLFNSKKHSLNSNGLPFNEKKIDQKDFFLYFRTRIYICYMKLILAFFTLLLIPFINYSQIQAGFSFNDSICQGDCITFTDTSSGTIDTWVWSFGGLNGGIPSTANTQDPGVICFDSTGTFTIDLGVSGPGGVSNFSATIFVGSYPDSIDVSGDTLIDMGGSAYIAANGYPAGGTYNWIPNDIMECPDCAETVSSPLVPTDAIIEYISPDGCALRDTVTIGINFLDVIAVPNSFSPDDNGVNDVLYVKGPGIVTMTFRVFDRYGRKLYETSSQDEGWDGTFNGRKLPPATFMWTVEYSLIGGLTNVKSGTVTLVK